MGLCPFMVKTAFVYMVSPAKGYLQNVFGCGKSGTAVNFIMDLESLSYPGGTKYLANNKYGIEIVEKRLALRKKHNKAKREYVHL